MIVRVTTVQEIEIIRPEDDSEAESFDKNDVQDSLMDNLLDAQGSGHETSDGKFMFTPGTIIKLEVEEIAG